MPTTRWELGMGGWAMGFWRKPGSLGERNPHTRFKREYLNDGDGGNPPVTGKAWGADPPVRGVSSLPLGLTAV